MPGLLSAPVREMVATTCGLRGVIVEITEQQRVDDYAALQGLTALGVPFGQGFFLGRPAPAMGDEPPGPTASASPGAW